MSIFYLVCGVLIITSVGRLLSSNRCLMDTTSYREITETMRQIMEMKID